nr:hypothetical protein [Tanacetum cinerariifolium]
MTGNQKIFSSYKAYNGSNVIFSSNLRGNIIGKGRGFRKKGLYVMKLGNKPEDKICLATIDENSSLWHKRLGHANMHLIQSLASKELVRNFPKLKFDEHFCDACKIGKQAHVNHKGKNIVSTTKCLELLHMDLFGPSAVWSYEGNRYTLVIVNDYSRISQLTFDETSPSSKTSPLVDDDLDKEEAIKITEKKILESEIEDETLEIDEIFNIKESRNHPLENVIGNLNQRTLRSQAQNQNMCDEFAKIMHDDFEMRMMGELNFFLGLQIKQMEDGIFFNQSKYIKEMLKKFGLEDSKPMKTPMSSNTTLMKDEECELLDSTKYQGMIGSLLYLTTSRSDIMFSVCLCDRFQEAPKTSHLEAVKRIFRYIKYTRHKGTSIETVVYADSDHAGDYVDRKITSDICTFVRCCLTSWFSEKQTALAISTTKAEYVSVGKACQQALWIKQALIDYDVRLDDVLIICNNKGAIDLSKNPVQHSQTKHIEIHFLCANVQKGHISIEKVSYVDNITDILTKPLKHESFNYLPGSESRPPMLNKENYVPWSSRLLRYAKSRPNGKLIHNSILNGPYVRRMIAEPGDAERDVNVNETFHKQIDDELPERELKQIEADDQAIQTILLGLPKEIYATVDNCETAQEIWLRVQQMMKGSDIGIQEKKAKLFNESERFTSNEGESIESYYHCFLKLMNDLKRNKHFPEKIASNLKFLNNL